MERCIRCEISEDKAQLFDVIYEGRASLICERCSIIENISIINMPSKDMLKEAEKGGSVYNRLRRIGGYEDIKKDNSFLKEQRLKDLEMNPALEHPKKDIPLVDYFHWEIMKYRRRKGLTQKKLAEYIEEPESAIQMLEKAIIPENPERIIRKLEQFLQIKLIKVKEIDFLLKKEQEKPILLDEYGNPIDFIPESETELEIKPIEIDFEREDFDFSELDTKKINIKDLREIHKNKVEVTKEEKIEEQKMIEEKQKLVEARKEEFRTKKEKESKELDSILGGIELLKKPEKENKDKEEYF